MKEFRRDPIVDRWVIISAERAARPGAVVVDDTKDELDFCPFCEGNESSTPKEVYSIRKNGSSPDGPGWSLRVVPNKYPALGDKEALTRENNGLLCKMSGVGAHEVIIESPTHSDTLADISTKRVGDLFIAVRSRFLELKKNPEILYAQFFKNHGHRAGASLWHTHSQIIAIPVLSKLITEELDGSARYFNKTGKCIYCDIISTDSKGGERVVIENDDFIALTPYAPRFAFETWILPKRHTSRYELAGDTLLCSLADIYKQIASKINKELDNPPYNLILHTAPFEDGHDEYFHWHVEFMPILGGVAGFEWGSGFHINSTPPEEAARRLRLS